MNNNKIINDLIMTKKKKKAFSGNVTLAESPELINLFAEETWDYNCYFLYTKNLI